MYAVVLTLGMVAVGVLVWRLIQRQDAASPDDDES